MNKRPTKIIAILLCILLAIQQTGFAQAAAVELNIAGYFVHAHNALASDVFRPAHLRYLSYDTQNNNFKLLLDKGDFAAASSLRGSAIGADEAISSEAKQLLKYFFIGLSLPNDAFWVNLRPDSPDNIIDSYLAQTDIGRIMLESDLQLKKDTARATSPNTPEGKDYWNKLYQKAQELFGQENITIPTLTRPWIVPDQIIIGESSEGAYVYKATLKVMLEEDYLESHKSQVTSHNDYSFKDPRSKVLNEYSSQLIREKIIPQLTKRINTSKDYAPLRQVYYSLILAQWFKARHTSLASVIVRKPPKAADESIQNLINSHNLSNLQSKTPYSVNTYFNAYKENFARGEYNIQESVQTPYGQTIRSYFSGGISGIAPTIPGIGSPRSGGVISIFQVTDRFAKLYNQAKDYLVGFSARSLDELWRDEEGSAKLPGEREVEEAKVKAKAKEKQAQPAAEGGGVPLDMGGIVWDARTQKEAYQTIIRVAKGGKLLPTEYESMAYAVAHGYVESGVLNKLSGDEAFVSAVTGSVGALGTLKDGILLKLKQSSSQSSDSTGVGNKDWKANDVVQNRKTNQIGVVYGTPLTTKGEKVVVVEFDNGETSKYSLDEAANALSLIGLNRAQAIEEGSPQADRRSELLPMTKEVDTIITTLIHDAAGANEQVLEEKYYEAEMQCSERILAIEDILRKEYQGAPPQEIMNAYAATLAITSVAFYEDIFSECKLQLGKRAGIALSLIVDKYDKQAVEGKLWSFMAKLASPLTDEKIRNIRLKIPVVVTPMNGLEELKKLQNSVGWFEMSFSVIYPEGVPSPLILITKGEGIVTIAKLAELFWAQFHTHYYVVPLKASDTDMQFCSYYAKEGKKVGIIGFGEKDGHVEVAMYSSVDKKFIYTRTNQAHVAEILENAGLLQQGVPPDMGGIGFLSHIFERIKQRVTGGAHTNLNNNENDVLLWGLLSVDQADREATTRLIAKLSKKEQEALRQRAALWQRKDALARLEDAFAEIALGRPRLMPPDNILKDLSPDAREYYWALANAPELMQKLLTAPDLHSCVAVVREMIKEYELKPVVGRDQDLKVFGKEANESWDDYFNSSSYKALRAKLINYSDFNSAEIEILDSTLRLLMKEAPELFELIFMYLIQIRKADAEISKIMADNSYRGYCWKGAMYLGDQVNKTFSDEHGLARTMVHEFMHGLLNNRTGTGRSGAVAEALAIKVETELMVVESLELENSFVELSRLDTEKSQGEIEKEIAHIRHYWDELRSTMRRQVDDDATDRGHWGRGQDAIVEAMIAALRAYEVPIDRSSRDFFVVPQISPDDERYVGDSTRISVPLSSESGKSDGAGARLLPTVPETTAPLQQSAMSQSATTPGGIDFRFLPIVTQSLDSLKLSLRGIPQSDLQRINLIQEWSSIEKMVNAGIAPSAERLKCYMAASCYKGDLDKDMQKISSCITDILRMQELTCSATDPGLADMLVVLGSGRSGKEIKEALGG